MLPLRWSGCAHSHCSLVHKHASYSHACPHAQRSRSLFPFHTRTCTSHSSCHSLQRKSRLRQGREAGVLHAQGPAPGQAAQESTGDGKVKARRQVLNLRAIADGPHLHTTHAHDLLNSIWLGEYDEVHLEGIASQALKEELQSLMNARGFRMLQDDAGEGEDFTVSRWTILPPIGPMTYAAGPRSSGVYLAKSTVLDTIAFEELLHSMNLQPGCGEAVFRIYPNVMESAKRLQAAAQKRDMHLVFYEQQWAVVSHASEPQPSYRADMDPNVMDMKLPWRLSQAALQAARMEHQARPDTAVTADVAAAPASEDQIIQEYINPSKWFTGSHSSGRGSGGGTSATESFVSHAEVQQNDNEEVQQHDDEEGDEGLDDPWWASGDEPTEVNGGAAQTAAAIAEAGQAEQEEQLSVRDVGLYRGRVTPRNRKPRNPEAVQKAQQRLSASLHAQQRAASRSRRGQRLRKQRSSLPVFEEKSRLMRAISDNQVIIVSGETGSGKSTQVPQYIIEDAISAKKGGGRSVLVTQPRRVSAISLAQRVAYERSETVGDVVGYKVRLEAQASYRTRLLFCTSGVALRRLLVDPELQSVSHVILDEVHERAVNTDFLLVALRDLLPRRPDLKVILMSATINAASFADYFGGCPHIALKGRRFEVQERYLPDILSESKWRIHTDKERVRGLRLLRDLQLQQEEVLSKIASREREAERGSKNQQPVAAGRQQLPSMTRRTLTSTLTNMKTRQVAAADVPYDSYEEHSWHRGYVLCDGDFPGVSKDVMLSMANWMSHKVDKVDVYLVASTIRHIHETQHEEGSILVFLPGWSAICDVMTLLTCGEETWRNLSQQEGHVSGKPKAGLHPPQTRAPGTDSSPEKPQDGVVDGMWVLPMHSALKIEDQQLVFQPPPPGARKVVLATNVAETSLTIPDAVYVVDTGRHNERGYDPVNKLAMLQGAWISRASADQRKGRAGRVRPGICYRLYPKNFMERHMEPQNAPELQRIPLEELCLQICYLGLGGGNPPIFLSRALSPPNPLAVRNAMELLVELGALSQQTGSWQLTGLGAFLAQLPLDPCMGKMLVMGSLLGCLDPVLSVAAVASVGRSPYERLMFKTQEPLHKRQLLAASAKDAASDHFALASAVSIFQQMMAREGKLITSMWCTENFIDPRVMQDVLNIRVQLAELLADIGLIRPPDILPTSQSDAHDAHYMGGYIDDDFLNDSEAGSWMDIESSEEAMGPQYSEAELTAYWEAYSACWTAYYSGPNGSKAQELQERVAADASFAGTEQYRVFYEDWCAVQARATEQGQEAAAAVRHSMEQAAVPPIGQQQQRQQQPQQQGATGTESPLVRGSALNAAIRMASLHSREAQLVKGALVAGMYPRLALVRLLKSEKGIDGGELMKPVRATDPAFMGAQGKKGKKEGKGIKEDKGCYRFELRTLQDGIVTAEKDSLVSFPLKAVNWKKHNAPWLPHRWLVFSDKVLTRSIMVGNCTPVNDAAVLLFGGELSLVETDSEPPNQDAALKAEESGGWAELHTYSGLIKYLVPKDDALALLSVRTALNQLIQEKIDHVHQEIDASLIPKSTTADEKGEQLVASVSRLLQASDADSYYVRILEGVTGPKAAWQDVQSPEDELAAMQEPGSWTSDV